MKTFEIENILTLEEDKVAGTKIIIDQLDENQTKLQQAALHFTKEDQQIIQAGESFTLKQGVFLEEI
jgi:hypothetical protein